MAKQNKTPEEYAGFDKFGESPEWQARRQSRNLPMNFKLLDESGERTFALIFEKGAEVVDTIQEFAAEQRVLSSHFTGIGAFSGLVIGFFDRAKRDYNRIVIAEQVEVLSLTGDITFENDKPKVHAHVVVGKSDGSAYGGHLIEGHVFPTLELILVQSPKYLKRRLDAETGLALIDLDAA